MVVGLKGCGAWRLWIDYLWDRTLVGQNCYVAGRFLDEKIVGWKFVCLEGFVEG